MTIAMGLGLGMSGVSHAQVVTTGIAGSSHDFTDGFEGKRDASSGTGVAIDESWNGRGEICRVCHVPHDHGRATQRYLNGLLWNHGVSSATYSMYDNAWSSTLTHTQSAQPDGHAKLCLGCHDGTVGIDTFDKYAGGAVFIGTYDAGYQVPGFLDGGNQDLRGTHPISIAYAGDDTKLQPAATATWASGDTVASTLDAGKVQCSTCHDVHDQESVGGTRLLRTAQATAFGASPSAMCLTCHVK
jgi:hypothetical protein